MGLGEVGGGDAVADGGVEHAVLRDHGVAVVVRGAEEVLEAKIHGGEWKSLPWFLASLGARKRREG